MIKKNWYKRRFSTKKKNIHKILFIVVIAMTVGFAALNTTLQLIGTLNISRTTWNIHWANPTKTGGVTATKDATLKTGDNTIVEYEVNLANQGDYYEFTVDAQNEGTIDAMVTGIDNKVYENNVEVQKPDYLDFSVTYADGETIANNHLLASGNSEAYKVKVEYKSNLTADQLPTSTRNLRFTFSVTYMQSDEATVRNRVISIPANRTKDNLEVGDEICIKDECFNFIRYDGNDVVMLAKYNLKVGFIYNGTTKTGEYTSSDSGYGKQSSEVTGYIPGDSIIKGVMPYSETNYWDDNGTPKSKYPGEYYPSSNYPTVYDTDYVTEPDFSGAEFDTPGFSVAYYVEEYRELLENYGVSIKDSRILTYAEVTDSSIGCNAGTQSCPSQSFIHNTTFWLGSASGVNGIWYIRSDGLFTYDNSATTYAGGSAVGVRPVIVISKDRL